MATTQEKPQDTGEEPEEAVETVVTQVPKPSVGRVVLVNIGLHGGKPVLRPAIVVAADVPGYPDAATVAIFTAATDFPLPPGLNIRQPEVGSPAYPAKAPWQIEVCRYGTAPGHWSWPVRSDETFDVVE